MIESSDWQFDIEVRPTDWAFTAEPTWIAGWIWSPKKRVLNDLRLWIDGRPFLAIWGIPKPGLDERFLDRPGPPFLGFTILATPHPGATMLRLEVRDQTGVWQEIHRTEISVSPDAPEALTPSNLPSQIDRLVPALLRNSTQRNDVPFAALADELVSSAIAEPLNSLPNPPFHGALEEPRDEGWVRYGRLSITGWIAHRSESITRVTAMIDPLLETPLLHGLSREDIEGVFKNLPGSKSSAFVGHVDLPADTMAPVLLKIFAELSDGTKHIIFAQRFTPRIIAGADVSLPPLSHLKFAHAAWALHGSAKRHGLDRGSWRELQPSLERAWATYSSDAPARSHHTGLAPKITAKTDESKASKIIVATHNLNFEGAPWFIFELDNHLASRPGTSATIVSPSEGPMRAVFEEAGMTVQLVDLQDAFALKDPSEFKAALTAQTQSIIWAEADLIIANTMVTFWAVQAAKNAGKPSLLYIHESTAISRFFAPIMDRALFPVVEDAFRLASRVVFTADSTRAVHDHLGDRRNFTLLASWVDANRIDTFIEKTDPRELRRKHGLDPDAVQVVNIGSVCERKGQHVFIRALDLLKAELSFTYPDQKIQFVMVGARAGLYLDSLKQEIKLLDLENVVFIAETSDIFDFYRLANIFVCTSFEESFPRVLLESAAFHLPIVTTNVNGIPEMLAPEEAWHTPPGDRYRLAEAIKQALAAHFAKDNTRPKKARAAVLRKYHVANSLPQHIALADGIASDRN